MTIDLPEHTEKYLRGIRGLESLEVTDEAIRMEFDLDNEWQTRLPNDLKWVREIAEECYIRAARKHAFHQILATINMQEREFRFEIDEDWIKEFEMGSKSYSEMQRSVLGQESLEDLPRYDKLSIDLGSFHHYDAQVALQELVEMGGKGDSVKKEDLKTRLAGRGWSDTRVDETVTYLVDEDLIMADDFEATAILLHPRLETLDEDSE